MARFSLHMLCYITVTLFFLVLTISHFQSTPDQTRTRSGRAIRRRQDLEAMFQTTIPTSTSEAPAWATVYPEVATKMNKQKRWEDSAKWVERGNGDGNNGRGKGNMKTSSSMTTTPDDNSKTSKRTSTATFESTWKITVTTSSSSLSKPAITFSSPSNTPTVTPSSSSLLQITTSSSSSTPTTTSSSSSTTQITTTSTAITSGGTSSSTSTRATQSNSNPTPRRKRALQTASTIVL